MSDKVDRRHQYPWSAEAALKREMVSECLLKRREFGRGSKTLDRRDRGAVHLNRVDEAGAAGLAVDQYGASAADAVLTSDMCTRLVQLVPQEIGKVHARRASGVDRLAIKQHRDLDVLLTVYDFHSAVPDLRLVTCISARSTSQPATCRRYVADP